MSLSLLPRLAKSSQDQRQKARTKGHVMIKEQDTILHFFHSSCMPIPALDIINTTIGTYYICRWEHRFVLDIWERKNHLSTKFQTFNQSQPVEFQEQVSDIRNVKVPNPFRYLPWLSVEYLVNYTAVWSRICPSWNISSNMLRLFFDSSL